jgi:hypothetical protein
VALGIARRGRSHDVRRGQSGGPVAWRAAGVLTCAA